MQIFVFPLEGTTGFALSMLPSNHLGNICMDSLPVQWALLVLHFMGYWKGHGFVQNTKEFREIKSKAQIYESL